MWWIEVFVGAGGLLAAAVLNSAEKKANAVLVKLLLVGLALMAAWKLFFSTDPVFFPAHHDATPAVAASPAQMRPPQRQLEQVADGAPAAPPPLAQAVAPQPRPPHRDPVERLWRPSEPRWYLWLGKFVLWVPTALLLIMSAAAFEDRKREPGDAAVALFMCMIAAGFGAAAWWV